MLVEHIRLLRQRLRSHERPTFKSLGVAAVAASSTLAKLKMGLSAKAMDSDEGKPSVPAAEPHRSSILLESYIKDRAEGDQLSSNRFAIFTTLTQSPNRQDLPESLRACFRTLNVCTLHAFLGLS